MIKVWSKTTEDVASALQENLDARNPIFMMADSGARGSMAQIRQLAGMRGLIANTSGKTIEIPIRANYREGLNILEYFIAGKGARKGLADTALRTADSGYLTRRLVDVSQDVIIREEDCGAAQGIMVSDIREGNEMIEKLEERLQGRFAVNDILDPATGEVLVSKDKMMSEDDAKAVVAAGIKEVEIRSVLCCDSKHGVCSKCYGANLANGRLVGMGEAVGIIAAQSIGEPGTQLTMRTFHTGGVAGGALLMFGAVGGIGATAGLPQTADADPIATTHAVGDNVVTAQWFNEDDVSYVSVANAQGAFTFNQEGVTPNDELFNVFGTALTSMCSKPATELVDVEGGVANFYVNVGGNIKKNFTIDVRDLAEDANQETMMACSCATGSPFGQAAVIGVPLASVVGMADLEDGVNTVTAYGADGYGEPLPLRYALEKNALLAYQVNGQELEAATGSSLQLWMPETVARYFTRDIVNIELTQEDAEPDVHPCYRNKINIMNYSDDCVFKAGDEITFEGVADDLGSPIAAIEFSFDNGRTWTSCDTDGATADKWVNWQFTTSFEEKGDYRMTVRAKTADGMVSPLAATLLFEVA